MQSHSVLPSVGRRSRTGPRAPPRYKACVDHRCLESGPFQQSGVHVHRLVISASSRWIPTLLHEFHATPQGGHSGFYRAYRRIAANVYWIGMKGMIQDFVKACDICQRQKYLATSPGGLLQPLPIPDKIWEELSMDFITGLPKVKGTDTVFVVVDRLSKYAHFIPLRHPFSARVVAEAFALVP